MLGDFLQRSSASRLVYDPRSQSKYDISWLGTSDNLSVRVYGKRVLTVLGISDFCNFMMASIRSCGFTCPKRRGYEKLLL